MLEVFQVLENTRQPCFPGLNLACLGCISTWGQGTEVTSGPPMCPWWVSRTTRNSFRQACPTGWTKMHVLTGAHFLFLSISPLFSLGFTVFAFGFITLECPFEYCSEAKLPHFTQCIGLGSRFYFLYLILDSKQDTSIFPNSTSLPPLVSPWWRGLTNL